LLVYHTLGIAALVYGHSFVRQAWYSYILFIGFGFGTKVSPFDNKDSSWVDNAMPDKFNILS